MILDLFGRPNPAPLYKRGISFFVVTDWVMGVREVEDLENVSEKDLQIPCKTVGAGKFIEGVEHLRYPFIKIRTPGGSQQIAENPDEGISRQLVPSEG
jgi:hypothetical protein